MLSSVCLTYARGADEGRVFTSLRRCGSAPTQESRRRRRQSPKHTKLAVYHTQRAFPSVADCPRPRPLPRPRVLSVSASNVVSALVVDVHTRCVALHCTPLSPVQPMSLSLTLPTFLPRLSPFVARRTHQLPAAPPPCSMASAMIRSRKYSMLRW